MCNSRRHDLAKFVGEHIEEVIYMQRDPYTCAVIDVWANNKHYEGIGFSQRNTTRIEKKSKRDYALDAAIQDLSKVLKTHECTLGYYQYENLEGVVKQLSQDREYNRASNPKVVDRWRPVKGEQIALGRAIVDVVKQIMKEEK